MYLQNRADRYSKTIAEAAGFPHCDTVIHASMPPWWMRQRLRWQFTFIVGYILLVGFITTSLGYEAGKNLPTMIVNWSIGIPVLVGNVRATKKFAIARYGDNVVVARCDKPDSVEIVKHYMVPLPIVETRRARRWMHWRLDDLEFDIVKSYRDDIEALQAQEPLLRPA